MRRLFLVLTTATALACGSDSDDGGGGPAGTVGGRSFATLEARAVSASTATPCSLPNPFGGGSLDIGIRGLKLDLASFANVCGDYATPQCKLHANGQIVTVIFAKLNPLPPHAPPALAPGSYTVYSSPTTAIPDADNSGLLTVAYAQALGTGAAPECAGAPSPAVQGGTLRIDQISDAQVSGSVNLSFADGSTVAGAFTAPACTGVTFDVCQIATTVSLCSLPPACQ